MSNKIHGKDKEAALARLQFMAEEERLGGEWSAEAARDRCAEYGVLITFALEGG